MTNSANAIHPSASTGYTSAADKYVQGRPDYPAELAAWLRDQLGLQAGVTVVDLGAGSGKFTPLLIATGASVSAVEPVPAMLAKLSSALPSVKPLAGTAESIPLPDASVDAIVCAQAFHWFATPAALAEIHRVLKPDGRLGLVWNLRDARIPWIAQLDQIVNRVEGDTPRYHSGAWRKAFPFPGFGPLHEQHFLNGHTGTPEDVILNRVRSTSFIAALPAKERAKIEAQIHVLIASTPELHGHDQVTVPYETAAYHTIKTGGPL